MTPAFATPVDVPPPALPADAPTAPPPALPALPPETDPEGLDALLAQVEREHGFRVRSYKERCLRRRLAVRMRAAGAHTYADYARALERDPREYERLLDSLTINVTKLFRNWDAWEALDERVLAPFWAGGGPVRAWSAGCASGEEPYSLAALLHARAERVGATAGLGRVQVLGTDVDAATLAAASAGLFGEAAFADAPPPLRARYFPPLLLPAGASRGLAEVGAGAPVAAAAPELRALVRFDRHDLLREPPPGGPWELIVCRNVVIYFDRESQEALFERFHAALAPGGVLFLGKVETLLGRMRTLFAPVDARQRLFRRL